MQGIMPDMENAETQRMVTVSNLALKKKIPFHSFPFPLRTLVLIYIYIFFLLTSCVTLKRK